MAPARRNHRRRDWPARLYEPRPGYYVWRHPDGTTYTIGAIPFAVARNEALQANAYVAAQRPGLVARLSGATNTVEQLLERMPVAEKPKTATQHRYYDGVIRAALGSLVCATVTVRDVADMLEPLPPTARNLIRGRARTVFRKGMALGWMHGNPAEATETVRVRVTRGRLTLETFQTIRAAAPAWAQRAMDVALVLGCDVSTLASLHRRMVADGHLTFTRQKTGAVIRVPLALRLDVAGLCLADLVPRGIRSFVHDPDPHGNAGPRVTAERISAAFTEARRAVGLPDAAEGGPSFHEIRSLAKRLYTAQGNVDTLALLGHADERTGDLYADPRGVEPVLVRVG